MLLNYSAIRKVFTNIIKIFAQVVLLFFHLVSFNRKRDVTVSQGGSSFKEQPCDSSEVVAQSDSTRTRKGHTCKEIPSLVVTLVISTIKDVRVLKRCRLVCRSWNTAACRALKACSIVRLSEGAGNAHDFRNVLCNSSLGPLSYLSSPFQNFSIVATSFSNGTFTNLLNLAGVTFTKFILARDEKPLRKKYLEYYLKTKGKKITDISIDTTKNVDESFDDILSDHNGLLLTSLKHLRVKDKCSQQKCQHVNFLKKILRACSLESVFIIADDVDNFGSLTSAAICERMKTPIPKLTSLGIQFTGEQNEAVAEYIVTLIINVASSIESLIVSVLKVNMLPVLPKLQSLIIDNWEGKLGKLTSTKFPSLRHVSFGIKGTLGQYLEAEFHPHDGVQSVTIIINEDAPEINDSIGQKHLNVFASYLKCQFPEVTELDLVADVINTSMLSAVQNAFPELKVLRINGACDFPTISGTPMSIVSRYLESEWSFEGIPRTISVFGFQKLVELVLGPKFTLTEDIIRHCISRIPTLKFCEFHWNSSLSVEKLSESLGHLCGIQIHTEAFVAGLRLLEQTTPRFIIHRTKL